MLTHAASSATGVDAAHALAGLVMRPDRDELALRALRMCAENDRRYAELPRPVLDGPVLDGIRAMIDLLCALLADDAGAQDVARDAVRISIAERHDLGLPAAMACDATQAICQTVWSGLVDVAEPTERTALTFSAGRVLGAAEVLADLMQIYSRSPAQAQVGIEKHSRKLLDALVDPAVVDLPSEPVQVLRFQPCNRYHAFAVAGGSPAGLRNYRAVALDVGRRGGLAVTRDQAVVGVLPEGARSLITGSTSVSALSEPVGRTRLAVELEFVLLLARVARELGHRGVVADDELLLERLLLRSSRLLDLVEERVIAPLVGPGQRAQLVATLVACVDADFDRRRAAARLHIHPGSLSYRLRRIEKATSLRFDRHGDLMLLTMGARAHQLLAVQAKERGA